MSRARFTIAPLEIEDLVEFAAKRLWKYGARAASPRRIGPLTFPS
jgi:hypothetical protein